MSTCNKTGVAIASCGGCIQSQATAGHLCIRVLFT